MMIRLVLFDAFATIIHPRLPIFEQYYQVFKPHFEVEKERLKPSFKTAIKQVQIERPAYTHDEGVTGWWRDVIRRTAIGAGAEQTEVDIALPQVVPMLMKRFSSAEGYTLYDDVILTFRALANMGILLGATSNGDSRIRDVLRDLEVLQSFGVCVLSEEEKVEKPSVEIWVRSMTRTGLDDLKPHEVLHVGDELICDYQGATGAGLHALLLRRPGQLGNEERKEEDEVLDGINVISSLSDVVRWVSSRNNPE